MVCYPKAFGLCLEPLEFGTVADEPQLDVAAFATDGGKGLKQSGKAFLGRKPADGDELGEACGPSTGG